MSLGVYFPANKPYSEMAKTFVPNLTDYYRYPEKYTIEPFRIFGNLYYVGDKKVCCHLVDTGNGLILIDSGYAHTMHLLLHRIQTLGFAPADIKIIIHSHGHFDHFGCSRQLKALYGCHIYMGRPDVDRLHVNEGASLMKLGPEPYSAIPETDVALDDGDVITLGQTRIRCVAAPGHSEGVMAFFFDVTDGTTTKQVGYWGGVGFFTMHRAHLEEYDLPLDLPQRFGQTIQRLRRERADITIGNHPTNNGTYQKYMYMREHPGENPFVDPTVWREVLDIVQNRLDDFNAQNFGTERR